MRDADAAVDGIKILAGSEVNVLPDGSLDYEDDLLAELDWIVGSLHSAFRTPEKEQTERMIRAMQHPLVDAIGHPTGRLIERREPYALDIDAVVEAAAETGTFLEINGNPDRRDLNELNAAKAVAKGVKLVIDSDAHQVSALDYPELGIGQARRAWLTKDDVVNTRTWAQVRRLRKRRP